MKVTIHNSGEIQCNRKPFFALQGRHLPVGATLKDLADAGFNCFRHLIFGSHGMDAGALPDNLHGLKICAYLFNRANLRTNPSHRDELTKTIVALRDHPDLLCYENYNEPARRSNRR